jgi:DUF4097 and DUF4098 domain-containing protein YvlB
MKRKFAFVILGLMFLIQSINVLASETDKDKTFNVSKGENLVVTLSNGNITINTWDKDQVYIKAKNVDEDDLQNLHMEKQGNKVIVDFNGTDSDDFTLEIAVPTKFNLDLSSGGGNVTITNNILGKVDITTGGGNIKLKDIEDKLSVSTGGGNVAVGNVNSEAEISTGGGNIEIGDVKSRVDVSTGGGNVKLGNIGGNASVSTAGGIITVGKVTGSAELSTAGGNINLDGATGRTELSTAGGNISAKNISGSVEGSTAGGNINIELTSSPAGNCEFNTAGGDISITIPSNAKVSIEANVYVGRNIPESEANKFIKSDFEESTVNFSKGNFVKTFIVNGGGSSVELNTASGKIRITKK